MDLKASKSKFKDLAQTNYELGLNHLKRNNLKDAIFRFKLVIKFRPQKAEAYYNLGRAYMLNDEIEKASVNLKKSLDLNPSLSRPKYYLQQIQNPEEIIEIPLDIVLEKYIPVKNNYGDLVESEDGKKVIDNQKLLKEEILKSFLYHHNNNKIMLNILDIQCAKGFFGQMLSEKGMLRSIVGLELYDIRKEVSESLMDEDEKPVYDKVLKLEAREFLIENRTRFDCIFMPVSMCHFGDVKDILFLLKSALNIDGFLCFSVVDNQNIDEYAIDLKSNMFSHNKEYIIGSLKRMGYKEPFITDFKQIDGLRVSTFIAQRD